MIKNDTIGQYSYRKMTTDDVDQVCDVENDCFKIPWSRESFWNEVLQKQTYYMVAIDEISSKIIGYVGVWILGDEGHITNVAISPEYRNRGIAYNLMISLILEISKIGVTSMTLEVRPSNITAMKLYSKLKFVSVGRRPNYYEDGEDAEIMWNTNINMLKND